MKLVEGFASSQRRRYSYRGHVITQEYRPHDVRNKTHNGYFWHVEITDIASENRHNLTTRADAKAYIDRHETAEREAVA